MKDALALPAATKLPSSFASPIGSWLLSPAFRSWRRLQNHSRIQRGKQENHLAHTDDRWIFLDLSNSHLTQTHQGTELRLRQPLYPAQGFKVRGELFYDLNWAIHFFEYRQSTIKTINRLKAISCFKPCSTPATAKSPLS